MGYQIAAPAPLSRRPRDREQHLDQSLLVIDRT
jgi:hypothetical protein